MKTAVKGVFVSLLFALWVEFFYKFGAKLNPDGFFVAIPVYILMLSLAHKIFSKLQGVRWHRVICVLIGGFIGLMVEWFLVGNAPWLKPNVLQSGQFMFHGMYPILGYLLVRVEITDVLKRRLVRYIIAASAFVSIGFVISNPNIAKLWFIFMPLFSYVGFYYFIYALGRFSKEERVQEADEMNVD